MTRRRAAWLIVRHLALWPWPRRDEPPIPDGHPWLDWLAWLRSRRAGVVLIVWVWLCLNAITIGAGMAGALMLVPLLRTPHTLPARLTASSQLPSAAGRVYTSSSAALPGVGGLCADGQAPGPVTGAGSGATTTPVSSPLGAGAVRGGLPPSPAPDHPPTTDAGPAGCFRQTPLVETNQLRGADLDD